MPANRGFCGTIPAAPQDVEESGHPCAREADEVPWWRPELGEDHVSAVCPCQRTLLKRASSRWINERVVADLCGGLSPSFWQLLSFAEFLERACKFSASTGAAAARLALANDSSVKKHLQRIAYR
eukprot:8180128-Pyramimonas_sp.AAC.1